MCDKHSLLLSSITHKYVISYILQTYKTSSQKVLFGIKLHMWAMDILSCCTVLVLYKLILKPINCWVSQTIPQLIYRFNYSADVNTAVFVQYDIISLHHPVLCTILKEIQTPFSTLRLWTDCVVVDISNHHLTVGLFQGRERLAARDGAVVSTDTT